MTASISFSFNLFFLQFTSIYDFTGPTKLVSLLVNPWMRIDEPCVTLEEDSIHWRDVSGYYYYYNMRIVHIGTTKKKKEKNLTKE